MAWYVLKVFLTALIIVVVSEAGKRSSFLGALLASIPLVSVLAMIWMHYEKATTEKINDFSTGVFWLVLPSLPFFLLFPLLMKKGFSFWTGMGISLAVMIALYFGMSVLMKKG